MHDFAATTGSNPHSADTLGMAKVLKRMERGNIARLVLRSGAKIAVTGCALGILGSLCVSRLVGAFLFEVSATNPIVYLASVVLMLLLTLLASALPAVRAAAADPAQALRSE